MRINRFGNMLNNMGFLDSNMTIKSNMARQIMWKEPIWINKSPCTPTHSNPNISQCTTKSANSS